MKLRAIMIAIGLALSCYCSTLAAQVPDDYLERIGVPDFSINAPVEMGAINVANGNLHLEIPLASLAQRTKARFELKLVYDSQLYGIPFGNLWRPNAMIDSLGGWRVMTSDNQDIGSGCFLFNGFPDGPCPGPNYSSFDTECEVSPGITSFYTTFTGFSYMDATGLSKSFPMFTYASPDTSMNCFPDTPNASAYADDGSGYLMTVTGHTGMVVYDNQGNQIYPSTEDSNGNVYGHNANGVVDFVGRNPVLKTIQGNLIYLDVLNSQGTRSRYTLTTTNINVHTAFGPSFMTEYTGSLTVIHSVTLPNNTSYTFDYDSGTASGNYGLLKSNTLPSGAVVQYTYTNFDDSQCSRSRWVSSRTSEGNVWSYTPSVISLRFGTCPIPTPGPPPVDGVHQVTAVMPDNSSVVYTFAVRDQSGAWMTSAISRDPAGVTLQTVTKDYTPPIATRLYPLRLTTTLPFNGSTLSKKTEYSWSLPNLTEVREWDFYTGTAPATPTRVTDATYTADNPADVGVNILSKPTAITISDGAGHVAAKGVFEYDIYTNGLSLSGAVQHDAAFGTGYTTRGNLTAVSRLLTSDGSFVVTRNQYDDAGNITSTMDPGLHNTTFSYTDVWSNASCAPSSGNSAAYVTKVTNAKSQASNSTYNSCTGTLASSTDVNNNTTNFSYADSSGTPEPLDRIVQTKFPPDDSGVQGKISKSYNEAALPFTLTTTTSITSMQDLIETDKLDDLGRTVQKAVTSDPQGTVYSLMSYDFMNRKSKVNNPTRCNPPDTNCGEATWGFVSYLYDVLNQPTITTSQDGGTTRYSYNGNTVTLTDEAGKQRRTVIDGLGRLIEVDEPGGARASGVQATASVTVSGAFSSTWVLAGTPHLAATGTTLASVTMADGSSHDFYFDTNQHLCQMSWISGSGWFDQDLTSMTESALPLAGSSIAATVLSGAIHVFYQGANLHIYDMNWTGSIWQNLDMTVLTGASPVSNTKMAIVNTGSPNTPMMFYEGTNQHLFCVYWNSTVPAWQNADLHGLSGASNLIAPNGSISAAMWGTTGNIHALFLDTNQNLNRIVWSGTAWITNNLTSITGAAVAVAGSKLTTISTGTPIDLMTFYEGAGQHIYSIYWNNSAGAYQTLDFTSWSGATNIAAILTSLANNPVGPHMFYFSNNQHLDDMLWNGSAWINADLTSLANTTAVPASGSSLSSHGTSGGNNYNIFFEGGNQHIYHTYYSPSASAWFNEDPLVTASNFVVDSGTVSLTIPNGTSNFTATVCYGYSTNPFCTGKPVNASSTDIANALAVVLNGTDSPVNATVGASLNLTWRTAGWVTATVASMASTSDYPTLFPSGSFSTAASTFSGGVTPGSQTLTSPLVTLYRYDLLGNLYCVEQHGDASTGTGCPTTPPGPTDPPIQPDANNAWRRRLYAYDSLSRLRWASNPESGVVSYTYDADGNLLQKTSPAPNQTGTLTQTISYCYDKTHLVTGKAYSAQTCTNGILPSGTAVSSYYYDQTSFNGLTISNGIGRRTGMTDQAGTEAWSYDSRGRTKADKRTTIGGVTKTTSYLYNLMGGPTSITYPSGTTISYAYNNAAHVISATDTGNSINYTALGAYSPAGSLSSLKNGTNLTSTFYYNNRLQPCRIIVTTLVSNPSNCFDPANTGNIIDFTYNFGLGLSDNGNVISIANNRDTGRNQSFAYDSLDRITTAQTSSTSGTNCFGESFGYDAWAGLLTIGGVTGYSGCTQENLAVASNGKNQITTNTYDAAGNMTPTGYTYDAENRLLTAGGVTYTYDGDGKRVEKSSGTFYWYGMGAAPLDETDLAGSTTNSSFNEYVFFNGNRTARRNSSNTVFYYFADYLGTSREIVQAGQTTPCYDADFYPFGGERTPVTNTCPQNYKFTGKERDSETGLDDMGARYFGSSIGRFITPDAFDKDSHVGDPQSWNKYAYARDNPLRYVDPTGEEATVTTTCARIDTCNVSITASIAIYAAPGSGLTQEQLNGAATTIQNSIEAAWSGSFTQDGVTYNVSTQVSVQVAASESDASSTGAQNVIGLSNGPADAAHNGNAFSGPGNSLGTIFRGQDTGIWNYNTLGTAVNTAAHEFTHLLGVWDKEGYVLSNTNPSARPFDARAADLHWGVQEAVDSVNVTRSMMSWGCHEAQCGSVQLPNNPSINTKVNVGAPSFGWWK